MSKIVHCINDYNNIESMVVDRQTEKTYFNNKNQTEMLSLNGFSSRDILSEGYGRMKISESMDFESVQQKAISLREEQISKLKSEIQLINSLEEPAIK